MFPRLKQRRFSPSLRSLLRRRRQLVLIVSELLRVVVMSQLGGALRSSRSPPSAQIRRLRGGRGEGSDSLPRRSERGKTREVIRDTRSRRIYQNTLSDNKNASLCRDGGLPMFSCDGSSAPTAPL